MKTPDMETPGARETEVAELTAALRLSEARATDLLNAEFARLEVERGIRRTLESFEASGLTLKQDWAALCRELSLLEGQPHEPRKLMEYLNHVRVGMLNELEARATEEITLASMFYEVCYRATIHTLQDRKARIKVRKTVEFEQEKVSLRERERTAAREKIESKEASRRRTPEEIMIESLAKIYGSETVAREQYEIMKNAAKGKA